VRFDEVINSWLSYKQHEANALYADLISRWRSESDRPTVLMVDSDIGAGDLIQELAKQGIRVPDEVSVCAVAGCGVSASGGMSIAQGLCDFRGMGRKAVELLRQRCEQPGEASGPAVYRVGFEWVEGGSTREARA
jgi:DNA-binding LacI/PurR family transcriptional regulator